MEMGCLFQSWEADALFFFFLSCDSKVVLLHYAFLKKGEREALSIVTARMSIGHVCARPAIIPDSLPSMPL